MNEHHINVFFSPEDGGWVADVPGFDACSAFGRTPVGAVAEVELARDAWIAAAREAWQAGAGSPPPARPSSPSTAGATPDGP